MYKKIKCIQLELSDPPVVLSGLNGYAKVRALVRFNHTPLGDLTVPVVNGAVNTELINQWAEHAFAYKISQIAMLAALRATIKGREVRLDSVLDIPNPGQTPDNTVPFNYDCRLHA